MTLKIAKRWRWLAKDKCGRWYCFTREPSLGYHCWYPTGGKGYFEQVSTINIGFVPVIIGDWEDSLHKRRGERWVRGK